MRATRRAAVTKNSSASDDGHDRQGVQVLARVGDILRVLKGSPGGVAQAELATRLGLARTTVHRLLNALAKEGLVQVSGAAGRYRLGSEILQMADAARMALISEVHPLLEQLSQELEETVDLSILDRNAVTFIDQVEAPQRLRAVSAVGASFPLHCTANGKAILATMSAAEVRRLVPELLAAETPEGARSREQLVAELASVARDGVAFDLEEHSQGICAIGIAIGATPLGIAALSVPMPVTRFTEKRDLATAALRKAADRFRQAFHRYGEGG